MRNDLNSDGKITKKEEELLNAETREFAIEEVFKVDVDAPKEGSFVINQSFTIMNWMVMERIIDDKTYVLS